MPLDHVSLAVPESKLDAVISFLTSALDHTGFKEHFRPVPHVAGCGEQIPYLWVAGIKLDPAGEESMIQQLRGAHVAFKASSKFNKPVFTWNEDRFRDSFDVQEVRQFHAAGLKAGGEDNGAPGRRPHYHPGYYGSFVRDPACGINFEMVFHGCPEDEETLRQMEQQADA